MVGAFRAAGHRVHELRRRRMLGGSRDLDGDTVTHMHVSAQVSGQSCGHAPLITVVALRWVAAPIRCVPCLNPVMNFSHCAVPSATNHWPVR